MSILYQNTSCTYDCFVLGRYWIDSNEGSHYDAIKIACLFGERIFTCFNVTNIDVTWTLEEHSSNSKWKKLRDVNIARQLSFLQLRSSTSEQTLTGNCQTKFDTKNASRDFSNSSTTLEFYSWINKLLLTTGTTPGEWVEKGVVVTIKWHPCWVSNSYLL